MSPVSPVFHTEVTVRLRHASGPLQYPHQIRYIKMNLDFWLYGIFQSYSSVVWSKLFDHPVFIYLVVRF